MRRPQRPPRGTSNGIRQHRHHRRQRHPRSRAPFHSFGRRRVQLRRRLEPQDARWRRAGVVLRRHLLAPARRERERVHHQGHPRGHLRPPRPAVVGVSDRRQAFEGRDHRRRRRPEPPVGLGRDHPQRVQRRRRQRRRFPGRRCCARSPTSPLPTTPTRSRSNGEASPPN